MSQSKYSIWLIPGEKDQNYLSQIIESLADNYGAPGFDPHVTLFSSIQDIELAKTIISQINYKPFQLKISGLNQSENIWKTIFLELEIDSHLTLLNYIFDKAFNIEYDFKPHISLIYKKMVAQTKESIMLSLELKNTYLINGIAIVDTTGPVKTWNKVHEVFWNF